jgi:similar to stage IV sporulation protein
MAVLLLVTHWASRRVWFVEVQGCERMDEAVLLEALREQGICQGRDLCKLPLSDLADFVAARYEELAFVELHVDGVFLRIRAREALAEGERLDQNVPCDLVSTREGVITKVSAYGGRAQVKVGDKVKKGQLLIAGRVTARDGSMTYTTHAYGEVLAAVLYKAQVEAPKTQVEWAETGEESPCAALYLGKWKLLERACPFEDGTLAEETRELSLSPWPIRVCRGTWREKVKAERTLTEAERKEAALFEAERMALLQVPRTAKVIMIDRYTVEKGGKLYGVCTVTTEENIGYTKEIT